jgi:YD repeat-containing protein
MRGIVCLSHNPRWRRWAYDRDGGDRMTESRSANDKQGASGRAAGSDVDNTGSLAGLRRWRDRGTDVLFGDEDGSKTC